MNFSRNCTLHLIQRVFKMCSSRKYLYSPHRRDWNFLGGGGFCKAKIFKAMYDIYLEFPEGWGVLEKIPSVGEVWIFSEITQYILLDNLKIIRSVVRFVYILEML